MTALHAPFPLKRDTRVTLTRSCIERNACDEVPAVTLVSGRKVGSSDTVTYSLDAEAAKLYRFDTDKPIADDPDPAHHDCRQRLHCKATDRKLVIRLNLCEATPFKPINLVFNLRRRDRSQALVAFDPGVGSGGGPRD